MKRWEYLERRGGLLGEDGRCSFKGGGRGREGGTSGMIRLGEERTLWEKTSPG